MSSRVELGPVVPGKMKILESKLHRNYQERNSESYL